MHPPFLRARHFGPTRRACALNGARLYLLLMYNSSLTQYAAALNLQRCPLPLFLARTDALFLVRTDALFLVHTAPSFSCATAPSFHVQAPQSLRKSVSFSCATAPSFHVRHAPGFSVRDGAGFSFPTRLHPVCHRTSSLMWNILSMHDSICLSRATAPPSSPTGLSLSSTCGISFSCARAFSFSCATAFPSLFRWGFH
ncbi:hypothetical protein B0H13DRAFT_2394406 [Mycena leptocephala]|nr:hypothetical protein B0H13DRAFT_2394406 [Mycena leptocephala]